MEALFKDGTRGEEVPGQQEMQDLPAAIPKLKVSERPSGTQDEHAVGRFALSEYLCPGINLHEMLLIVIALRVRPRRSKDRCAEPSFTMAASHAG